MPCSNSWNFRTGTGNWQWKGRSLPRSGRSLILHTVRFGGQAETVLPDLDPYHSEEDSDDAGRGKRFQRKPHRSTTDAPQDYTDSDTPEDADGLGERSQSRKKTCLPLTNQGVDVSPADMAALPSTARAAESPTPSPQPRTSCDVSRPRHQGMAPQSNFKQRAAQTRTVVRTTPLLGARNLPGQAGDSDQSGSAGNAPLHQMHLIRPT